MLTILSDTHGSDDHRLDGRTLEAVRTADLVLHAGDFTTEAVLDAFEAEIGAAAPTDREVDGETAEFVAVYGNRDSEDVRGRLGATRVVEWSGIRIVLTHGHDHDETSLDLLGRQEGANLVVVGHSHRPGTNRVGGMAAVNPGSHADPRQYRPAHAELESSVEGLGGRLVQPDGTVLETFEVAVTG